MATLRKTLIGLSAAAAMTAGGVLAAVPASAAQPANAGPNTAAAAAQLPTAVPAVNGYTLSRGDTGEAVFLWQIDLSRWLAKVGSDRHSPAKDGTYGPYTESLTRYFQQRTGLAADGVAGPRTDAAMNRALGRTVTKQPLLRRGDRGAAVRAWQRTLNIYRGDLRNPPLSLITADGVFGPQTEAATRDVQQRGGITVDGIVGPQTRLASGTI